MPPHAARQRMMSWGAAAASPPPKRLPKAPGPKASPLEKWGRALLASDVLNLLAWIGLTAFYIWRHGEGDEARVTAGFVALASPHTVIIPSMFAILSDLRKHCKPGVDVCLIDSPHWQWYLFPILAIPLDGLTLAYNLVNLPYDGLVNGAAGWSMGTTLSVLLWALCSRIHIRTKRNESKDIIAERQSALAGGAAVGQPLQRGGSSAKFGAEFHL